MSKRSPKPELLFKMTLRSACSAVIKSAFAQKPGEVVLLIKPQFEVGRERIGKGGIVRDEAAQLATVEKVSTAVRDLGGKEIEVIDSPILGTEGNREFLLHAL